MNELNGVIQEFLVESYENLDQLDRDLVELEKDPRNHDRLSSVFRTIHTIKGTCGFFGFGTLEKVAHVGENLLSALRDGILLLNNERTTALLALVDAVRVMLGNIEKTGTDGTGPYDDLIDLLTRLLEDGPAAPAGPGGEPAAHDPAPDHHEPAAPAPDHHEPAEVPAAASPVFEEPPVIIDEIKILAPNPEARKKLAELRANGSPWAKVIEEFMAAVDKKQQGDPRDLAEIMLELTGIRVPENVSLTPTAAPAKSAHPEESSSNLVEGNIRVDVGLLDKLMNLVGELVLARNQILQFNTTQKDPAFLSTTQRLNLITTELQEGVMKTRMQPIGNIWNRFPRVVRDLAVACGKDVRLEMEGKETELDKTIIEAIKDPLTHIVRNSVDHGIERPEVRKANGKPAQGTLKLRAYHEGGKVNIEIIDDGGGIHTEKVKAKAIERGLITREAASRMSDREATHLLFLPGFSTAEKITNVSGRGVGMDVVKTNIEKIGGTVDIQSNPGHGTVLKIKIPLTLAIIPALIVTSGGDRFAIPQVSLLELVRLEGELARKGIEHIHGAPVYRLRGNLLPLVYLNHELKQGGSRGSPDTINIVVLQADDRQFGLVVEGINDTEEIVVKPLGKLLKNVPVFAGSTIMGDGKVALILDVLGIAQRSGVVSEVRDRNRSDMAGKNSDKKDEIQTLLLLGMGHSRRAAIPLSLVARLEEIPVSQLERADGQEVVQYRGQIMTLIRLSDVLGVSTMEEQADPMQVVVYSEQGRSVGLVVDQILDIVETNLEVRRATGRQGVVASAVIQQRVTDLLDMHGIIRSADPSFFEAASAI